MKKLICAILVFAFLGLSCGCDREMTSRQKSKKITEMAQYVNDKYGYSLTEEDCVYFREEDYEHHGSLLGATYDIPFIAIFQREDEFITVTDRNGFLGDDGQLEELDGLICGYFEELTGLSIEYVEVRRPFNNYKDDVLNRILHRQMNEKLTEENIGTFMDHVWESVSSLELIFYFRATQDIKQQLDTITRQLDFLREHENLKSLQFYITDMESLNVYYYLPRVHKQLPDYSDTEPNEHYIQADYHVINSLKYFYSSTGVGPDPAANTFIYGGYCMLDRGYGGGFGSREVTQINQFGVVDLRDPTE